MLLKSRHVSVEWNRDLIHVVSIEGGCHAAVSSSLPRSVPPSLFAQAIKKGWKAYKPGDPLDKDRVKIREAMPKKLGCEDWTEVHRRYLRMSLSTKVTSKSWVVVVYGRIRLGRRQSSDLVYLRQPTGTARAEALLRLMAKYE